MNGKIKTKFAALFAVALMITVCVVPMVGGSEDVEAATTTETVTISGNVYAADGTTVISGVKVYVDGKANELYGISASTGAFSIINVPKAASIVVKVDTTSDEVPTGVNATTKAVNPVKGMNFPAITTTSADATISGLKFISGTVQISGVLKDKSGAQMYIEGVQVKNNNDVVATTATNGAFSFLAPVGTSCKLSAEVGGIAFASETFTAGSAPKDLKATDSTVTALVLIPYGTLTTIPDSPTSSGVTAVSGYVLGSTVFGKKVVDSLGTITISYYAYAKATENTVDATDTSKEEVGVKIKMNYDPENKNGIAPVVEATSSNTIPNNELDFKTTADYVSGSTSIVQDVDVSPASISVTPSSVVLVSKDANLNISKVAFIVDGKYYVGYKYLKNDGTYESISTYDIDVTYPGYKFNTVSKTTGTTPSYDFKSTNAAYVTGSASEKTTIQISANNMVIDDAYKLKAGGYQTDASGNYAFFVPKGTSVAVTAPDNYEPKSVTVSAVNGDTVLQKFIYSSTVTYTGQILLNGVAIKVDPINSATTIFQYSTDDGENFSNAIVGWNDVDEDPYYTVTVGRNVDASKMFLRIVLANTGYSFAEGEDVGYTAPVGVTGTTFATFNVKAQDQEKIITDADNMVLSGMDVEFVMVKGATYNEDSIVADLGEATTDVFGKVKISAASPATGDGYIICAIPSGECEYGKYNFDSDSYINATIKSVDKTVVGYYTTNGSSLDGFGMSYVAFDSSGKANAYGDAKIIDNKYYIIVLKTATASIKAKAVDGFTISGQDITGYATINGNISASKITVPLEKFSVLNMTNSEFAGNVCISKNDGMYDEGTVLVLSAEKVCYMLQNGGLQYEYTDAAVKYDFAGWYVNGKLLTEDCDTAITLSENVVIVAQYDEAVKVIGSQDVPEAGLDTNVLILGIVVVVIALIAVVYSVISKRD